MNKQIKKHFDQSTGTYKKAAGIQKKVAERCCSRIPEKNHPRVLEIGAGGGLLTRCFIQRNNRPEIYAALDISRKMLTLVPAGNVCLVQADGEKAPFREKSFNLLISSSAMQWYQDGPGSMLNNLSLLKRGGFFSLAIFVAGTFKEMARVASATGFGSLFPLPSAESFTDCLDYEGQNYESALEEYMIYFPTARDFLKSHKQTGATFTGSRGAFGKKRYRDFCRLYMSMYGEKSGIPVSYRVLYLWGQRSEDGRRRTEGGGRQEVSGSQRTDHG
jgi:malonyl-CoA O-methyltransferase